MTIAPGTPDVLPRHGLLKDWMVKPCHGPLKDWSVKPWIEKPRIIALVGHAPTRDHVFQLDPSIEVWSLNFAGMFEFPRLDRVFDVHWRWIQSHPDYREGYWDWLTGDNAFYAYLQESDNRVPRSVKFPLDDVLEIMGVNINRGGDRNDFMTCTLCYMIGLVVHEFEQDNVPYVIKLIGFEMEDDYDFQRDGAALALGVAAGKGIKIDLLEESEFLNAGLYGYEGTEMIHRSTVLQHMGGYVRELRAWEEREKTLNMTLMALMEKRVGITNLEIRKDISTDIESTTGRLGVAAVQVIRYSTSVKVCKHLLDKEDISKEDEK